MERVLDSHKTIPELLQNNNFHGAESSYLHFIDKAIELGENMNEYQTRYECILRRFEKLTKGYFERVHDKINSTKSLEYKENEDYPIKVIRTKNFI